MYLLTNYCFSATFDMYDNNLSQHFQLMLGEWLAATINCSVELLLSMQVLHLLTAHTHLKGIFWEMKEGLRIMYPGYSCKYSTKSLFLSWFEHHEMWVLLLWFYEHSTSMLPKWVLSSLHCRTYTILWCLNFSYTLPSMVDLFLFET